MALQARDHKGITQTLHNIEHHAPNAEQVQAIMLVRQRARMLAFGIHQHAVPSREMSLALTALEECVMWAVASIARAEEVPAEPPWKALHENRIVEAPWTWTNPVPHAFAPNPHSHYCAACGRHPSAPVHQFHKLPETVFKVVPMPMNADEPPPPTDEDFDRHLRIRHSEDAETTDAG